MSWINYVSSIAGDDSPSTIAKKINAYPSTVTRWGKTQPSPEAVVAFARAYSRPVIEAILAAGWITEEEARLRTRKSNASDLNNQELINELQRRLALATETTTPDNIIPITSPEQYPDEIPEPDYEKAAAADIKLPPDNYAE